LKLRFLQVSLSVLLLIVLLVQVRHANSLPSQAQRLTALKDAGNYTGMESIWLTYPGFATAEGIMSATPQDKLHHFKGGLANDLLLYLLRALDECDELLCSRSDALALWTTRLQV
jgi:hypothetical protein